MYESWIVNSALIEDGLPVSSNKDNMGFNS